MQDHRALADIAGRQYGVFSVEQAGRCGFSPDALYRGVKDGRLVVDQTGVYAQAGAPRSWERSLMAACLAAGSGAVVSHRAAARLWGLSDVGGELVEITVPRPRSPRPRRTELHRSNDLIAAHTTRRRRLPVTNPLRTMVDLGAVLQRSLVEDALERGLAARLFSVAAIEWMRNELSRQGRYGAGVIGQILDERALGEEIPDGLLEPRMARLLRDAGLPPAEFQFVVRAPDGRFLAEVDFSYPELLLAIEVDGYETHGTPRAMAKDFVRQNGLVPFRWHVLRFTWHQVVRQPRSVAAVIAQTLSAFRAA